MVVAVHAQEYVVFPWAPSGGGFSAENCGFSAVSAHQQGRHHPCRGAEADTHGLDVQQTIEFSLLLLLIVVDVPVVWSCRSLTSLSCRRDRSPWSCLFGRPLRLPSCSMFAWWSMPLFCRSCSLPVIVHDRCPWFRHCGFRGGAAGAVPARWWTSLCSCSDEIQLSVLREV